MVSLPEKDEQNISLGAVFRHGQDSMAAIHKCMTGGGGNDKLPV